MLLLAVFTTSQSFAQEYRDLVRMAMEQMEADSLDRAEGLIRQALRKDPGTKANAILYEWLGQIQERRGETDAALQSYSMGLTVSPTTLSLLMDRASLYIRMENEKKALVDCNEVLDLSPDHRLRAYLNDRLRLYKEARADYEHLISLEPMSLPARLGLAMLNSKDGRPREAMEQMDMLAQLFPSEADVFLIRGGMRQQRKQYEQALADFCKAVELAPDNADCFTSRYGLYMEMKQKRLARQDARTAISLGADPSRFIVR